MRKTANTTANGRMKVHPMIACRRAAFRWEGVLRREAVAGAPTAFPLVALDTA
jgi:hypothetical protein